MKIFLHAGLPRTATTVLQKEVFPGLRTMHYVGKQSNNRAIVSEFNPLRFVQLACAKHLANDPAGIELVRVLLPTVIKALKDANALKRGNARGYARAWAGCMETIAETFSDKPLLYSDESLVESMSGLAANVGYGDNIALEQLHELGFLQKSVLAIVLRDPLDFLKASYYKTMEFEHAYGKTPFSFDTYISRQVAIHDRRPSASRIFLCAHRAASRHFRSLCPAAVVTHYRDLVASDHVVDTLLGTESGEAPVSLRSFPRENNSWRKPEVNRFILAADGVPHGWPIETYVASFPETLRRYSLDQYFAADAADE